MTITLKNTGPKHSHQTECRVIYGDTDSGGVVYYANYLRFFEAGRTEILRANNISYRQLEEEGYILPVVECHTRYKASARYDDLLIIETSVQDVRNMSCRFNHKIMQAENQQLLTKGYTIHACVDLRGKLIRFPAYFLEKLKLLSID